MIEFVLRVRGKIEKRFVGAHQESHEKTKIEKNIYDACAQNMTERKYHTPKIMYN